MLKAGSCAIFCREPCQALTGAALNGIEDVPQGCRAGVTDPTGVLVVETKKGARHLFINRERQKMSSAAHRKPTWRMHRFYESLRMRFSMESSLDESRFLQPGVIH